MTKVDLSKLTHGEAFLAGMVEAMLKRLEKYEADLYDVRRAVEVLHWGIIDSAGEPRTRVKCRKKKRTAPRRKK